MIHHPVMASHLRVAYWCLPPLLHHEPAPDGGTRFLGTGNSLLATYEDHLPPITMVTDHPKSNETLASLQTVAEGRADILPVFFGMTWKRIQLVDFSSYVFVDQTYIFSRSTVELKGSVIKDVFDTVSYTIFVLLVAVQVCTSILLTGVSPGVLFPDCSSKHVPGSTVSPP